MTGAIGTFWTIVDITMRWASFSAEVVVGLYVDAQAFADGKQPLKTVTFVLTKPELDQLSAAMGPAVYMVLMGRPEFAGADFVQ